MTADLHQTTLATAVAADGDTSHGRVTAPSAASGTADVMVSGTAPSAVSPRDDAQVSDDLGAIKTRA